MSIEIKPRVSGFVTKVAVKNGAEVKKDELLFEIDPKAYRADLDVAKADCVLAEAELEFARVTLARIVTLAKQKAVSMEELDQAKAQELRVAASLAKARAKLEMARLNLDYTTIRAPMNGVVRGLIDSGNLAIADQTRLATVSSSDPIYVEFDMDQKTLAQIRRAISDGKPGAPKALNLPVSLRLAGDTSVSHAGIVDHVDTRFDEAGGVRMRAAIANPKLKDGLPRILPGMFGRVRVAIGKPVDALLVNDSAVVTNQGMKYVYVVDGENCIEMRRVSIGAYQEDGTRVISEGLKSDDRVVVVGLPRLMPGTVVQPQLDD